VAVYAGIIGVLVPLLRRRHTLAFAIAIYLAPLLLVSNLLVSIGATLGERLVYHSSVGFCLAAAYGIHHAVERLAPSIRARRTLLYGLLVALAIPCAAQVVSRNAVWRNDITLFTHDVEVVPNSVLVNGNAGARYIDLAARPENREHERELLGRAIGYLEKAVLLHPKFVNGYLSLGIAQFKLGEFEKARSSWAMAGRLYPGNPYLVDYEAQLAKEYLRMGLRAAQDKRLDDALGKIRSASEIDPRSAAIWYHLGGAYYTVGDYASARAAWLRAVAIEPDHADAMRGLTAIEGK
jgi:tetratricopeptide (TPR) repeat protein